MTQAEEFFNRLTNEIPHAKPGKMFGCLCMKMPNGKSAAMCWKDHLVVKLQGEDLEDAMNLEGTQLFVPMEGRPMKEWVQVPFVHKNKWKRLASISAAAVEGVPEKPNKKRT